MTNDDQEFWAWMRSLLDPAPRSAAALDAFLDALPDESLPPEDLARMLASLRATLSSHREVHGTFCQDENTLLPDIPAPLGEDAGPGQETEGYGDAMPGTTLEEFGPAWRARKLQELAARMDAAAAQEDGGEEPHPSPTHPTH
jgi:hypothetical protein